MWPYITKIRNLGQKSRLDHSCYSRWSWGWYYFDPLRSFKKSLQHATEFHECPVIRPPRKVCLSELHGQPNCSQLGINLSIKQNQIFCKITLISHCIKLISTINLSHLNKKNWIKLLPFVKPYGVWDQFDAEKFTVRIGENSYDLDGVKSVWYELGGRYEQHWFVSLLNL